MDLKKYLILKIHNLTQRNINRLVQCSSTKMPTPKLSFFPPESVSDICPCVYAHMLCKAVIRACVINQHTSHETHRKPVHRSYALLKMRTDAFVRHLRGCVYVFSEPVSVRAYLCNSPSVPGGRVAMVTVMVAADPGHQSCGLLCYGREKKHAQQVTWPSSPTTAGHVTLIALCAQEGHRTSGQSWLDSRKLILL